MRLKLALVFVLGMVVLAPHALRAQLATSRVIPFSGVPTTIAPGTTGQLLTIQLWDAATGGNQLYCENQTLDVDAKWSNYVQLWFGH